MTPKRPKGGEAHATKTAPGNNRLLERKTVGNVTAGGGARKASSPAKLDHPGFIVAWITTSDENPEQVLLFAHEPPFQCLGGMGSWRGTVFIGDRCEIQGWWPGVKLPRHRSTEVARVRLVMESDE